MHLKGRTAIVTGASRGIGRAIALRLAREGANIAFNYLSDEGHAESLKKEIKAMGVSALAQKADVRDYSQMQKLREAVAAEFKGFDILINNAGILKDAPATATVPRPTPHATGPPGSF